MNVAITQYHEAKEVEMLQFIDSFTNFCTRRSKNVVRNDVLGAHFVQTLSQQRARTRQINMSELCEASGTGEKKIKGGDWLGKFSIKFKRSAVFPFIGHIRAARGISPQAFEVSFVCLSLKAAAQRQTPLRNNRN